MPTFVAGYLGTVTLNLADISPVGNVVSLNMSRNQLDKPTFGNQWTNRIAGQRSGTFSAGGHIGVDELPGLQAAFESDAPIPFSLQIGVATEATDAGLYDGACVVTTFTIEASADGEWDWSIDAATDGAVAYTPPPPAP